ncbi:MAG: mechanosensitive ion channel [Planctomycetota bacterium]|nr:mechanosensitive ion channel [Planctomycetota bacterium]
MQNNVVDPSITESAVSNIEYYVEKLAPQLTTLMVVVVFLFFGWISSMWLARLTQRTLTKAKVDLTLTRFAGKAVKYAILLFVMLGCLSRFGIEMTSFAALIAACGFAIGLAFQGSLSNFAAGMMLLIFRPFKVGDFVDVGGQRGTVFEIGILATALDTSDNRRIIVPNSNVFGNIIENISFHDTRRVDVSVGVDYSADLDRTREVLADAIGLVDHILDEPESKVALTGLGASSVDWVVRVWVDAADYWTVRENLLRAVKMSLDQAKIGIPYPQMDVHLSNMPAS